MEFTLLLWGSAEGESSLAPEERRAIVEKHMAFSRELREAGAHVYAAPLEDAGAGRVVQRGLVTDGPFTETKEHERLVRGLLEARGAMPNRIKDAVMRAGGAGFLLFARLQPDTPGKLVAHAYSYEALEFAAYDLLARVAELAADDAEVAETA